MADNAIPLERTLALIKPDSVDDSSEIERIIKTSGFAILAKRRVNLSPEQVSDFYAEHYGKMFFTNLVSFMSAGPVVALVLAKENAIQDWRLLMGPTNPEEAKELYPDSVRALFGKDNTRNAVHGSDSRISSAREIGFFFPQIRNDQNEGGGANEYLEQYVTPTLNKSLAQLAKEKPKDPLQWLADHLEKNNPNKPDINLY
jgi:nucleoside diphosphate kinase